jgi:hypothetical protein
MKIEFPGQFSKNIELPKFTKLRPVGAGQPDSRTAGRTLRHDEANGHFSQFCGKAPKYSRFQ